VTKIEWTDETWNPVVGCTVVSPGCINCYAMKMAHRLAQMGIQVASKYEGLTKIVNGKAVWTGKARLDMASLDRPLGWRKPRMIFVNSMSDLFHEMLSDDDILLVLDVIRRCSLDGGSNCGKIDGEHTFQVLTKRAERMAAFMRRLRFDPYAVGDTALYLADDKRPATILKNLWLGVSVEDQKRAAERIPHLLATPAAVRWISAEPLLGPIDLAAIPFLDGDKRHRQDSLTGQALMYAKGVDGNPDMTVRIREPLLPSIAWVVAGGESGHGARLMHPDWARALRDQCAAAGVPFLFKQWGEFSPTEIGRSEFLNPMPERAGEQVIASDGSFSGYPTGETFHVMRRIGKKAAGRLLDGEMHDAYPVGVK
jgi:protein gp37